MAHTKDGTYGNWAQIASTVFFFFSFFQQCFNVFWLFFHIYCAVVHTPYLSDIVSANISLRIEHFLVFPWDEA